MNAGGAIYRQRGGTTTFGVGPVNVNVPRHHKIGPASIDLGGPIGGQGASSRDQALAARNARAGSALTGAGLRTIGNARSNLSAGLASALPGAPAYAPKSGLGELAGVLKLVVLLMRLIRTV